MALCRSGKNSISVLSSLKLMIEFGFFVNDDKKYILSIGFSFSFEKLQFNLLEDTIYK